jgi:hypothetical protein
MDWYLIGISIGMSSREKIPWPSSQCFGSGPVSGSAMILVGWTRIRVGIQIQEGKNDPKKIEIREEISSVEVLDVLKVQMRGVLPGLIRWTRRAVTWEGRHAGSPVSVQNSGLRKWSDGKNLTASDEPLPEERMEQAHRLVPPLDQEARQQLIATHKLVPTEGGRVYGECRHRLVDLHQGQRLQGGQAHRQNVRHLRSVAEF